MEHVIRAEGLKKRFGDTQALAGVDILARRGTVLGVLGPNGAGKTTAVRTLATLIKPDEGRAEVCGFDVVKDAAQVRRVISLTGQYASVDEELTGVENLIMIARLVGHPRREARRRAQELIDRFGLSAAGGRAAKTYSGGMRRRLDLAAGLVNDPQVIYLDEPTTGLDPRARNAVWDTVRELVRDGATVLLTTQQLDEAEALADRILVFDHGRVVADGTSEELKEKVGGQTLAVRALDRDRMPEVVGVVARITGARPETDEDTGLVTAPLDDPAALSAVVRGLDEAGVVASDLALRRPSLDEVFLSLTGHHAETEGEKE
ncbi:ATP-binding cassette domain-containing protein [Actinoallomurus iriomotensis]|jgi:oleandomycin transport system ATP-binding protein|uniref:Daunorubicin resistance protein DrrA family ABC transporter ATP-binding protein n=1 Tax=Actinoallomurus iriomotensis TaxID=478107 RepID=A0A9W6W208_9ACTN|nr:ATP-binding cassette domain-containing protein [Actinoallomurus iriomotensis]GLY87954.1 daunorubicin resistance protein DrrA family ABC transporter ATP-binding protein [Actinoallomurus iriomotensis]